MKNEKFRGLVAVIALFSNLSLMAANEILEPTGLDQIYEIILTDVKIAQKTSEEERVKAQSAATKMNSFIKEAIRTLGLANDGSISIADTREINIYLVEKYGDIWKTFRADYALVERRSDTLALNINAVRSLWGKIYDLGFESTSNNNKLTNINGNNSSNFTTVGYYLGELVREDIGELNNPDYEEVVGTTETKLDMIANIILNDNGLLRKVSVSDLRAGVENADKMNHLIIEAIKAEGLGNDKKLTTADIRTINNYLVDNHLEEWAKFRGENEDSGYNRVQNNGATTKIHADNLINSIADGIYNLGYKTNNKSRLLNQYGKKNKSFEKVACWLDNILKTDLVAGKLDSEYIEINGTTDTSLDNIIPSIYKDKGLLMKVSMEDIREGARTANEMNKLIVESIKVTGIAGDNHISKYDAITLNQYLVNHYGTKWTTLYGDDKDGIETGYHRIKNDGATGLTYNQNTINSVADGIYHLGFQAYNGHRLANPDRTKSVSFSTVAYWLNKLLKNDYINIADTNSTGDIPDNNSTDDNTTDDNPTDDNSSNTTIEKSVFQKQYESGVNGYIQNGIGIDDSVIESGKSFTNGSEYYISTSGSSTNSGKSEDSPWDLATFNAHRDKAGGDIYLFKRGDEFRGSIDKKYKVSNLKYGAYGTGTKPLFLGSIRVLAWSKTTNTLVPADIRDNVYEADISSFTLGKSEDIKYLYVNGKMSTLARYPNVSSPDKVNWLTVDEKIDGYNIVDNNLTTYKNSVDYWKGATLRIRTYSWEYGSAIIDSYNNGKLTMIQKRAPWTKGWGFYLENKLSELDYPNEWFYDKANKKLYFYPNGDINSLKIEASTLSTGVSISTEQDNTHVSDLSFKQFNSYGIYLSTVGNIIINNNNIQHCGSGIGMWNVSELTITNNQIDRSILKGINIKKNSGTIDIKDNKITNSGSYPIYGSNTGTYLSGVAINSLISDKLNIINNEIINSGYCAMEIGAKAGGKIVVQNNYITGSQLRLNDGAAIYLRSSNIDVIGNIIMNSFGNINDGSDGTTGMGADNTRHPSYGMGIYNMGKYKDIKINDNTIANMRDRAILIHTPDNYEVKNNTLYGNEIGIEASKGGNGLDVNGNKIFVANNIKMDVKYKFASHIGTKISSSIGSLTIDENKYGSIYQDTYISMDGKFDLESYQNFNGIYDNSSSTYNMKKDRYVVSKTNSVLLEETFEDCNQTNTWTNTSAIQGGSCESDTSKTGSKSLYKEGSNTKTSFYGTKNEFTFEDDKYYLVEFDSYADDITTYQFGLADKVELEGKEVYLNRIATSTFVFNNTIKHNKIFFKPSLDITTQVRFFRKDGKMTNSWIDNVKISQVEIVDRGASMEVYTQDALNKANTDSVLLINKTKHDKSFDIPSGYNNIDGDDIGDTSESIAPYGSFIIIKR
jgi:hypothetical protein